MENRCSYCNDFYLLVDKSFKMIPSITKAFGQWLNRKSKTTKPVVPTLPIGDWRWLNERNACPDCQGILFNPGPTGGMSMNIRCNGCGHKFCFMGMFTPDRIDNSDSVYNLSKVGTLEQITGWQGYFPHVNGFK